MYIVQMLSPQDRENAEPIKQEGYDMLALEHPSPADICYNM